MFVSVIFALGIFSQPPSARQIASAAEYNKSMNGASYLVLYQGKVIAEEYPNGGSVNNALELASGTKSFTGVTALCAQEEGLLTLDEPVSKTITEWQGDARRTITIRDLLTLSSGIPGREGRGLSLKVPSYAEAILTQAKAKPGAKFQYGPAPFMIFGEVMRRKLMPRNETVLGYMEKKIFKPLGMEHGFWKKDEDGNPHMPSGAHMTAREWSKFGEMIRHQGAGVMKAESVKKLFVATSANPSYGLSWWMPTKGGLQPDGRKHWNWSKTLPDDIVVAAGAGGQRLYVIPSRELTVVRQARIRLRDEDDDSEFLTRLLTK